MLPLRLPSRLLQVLALCAFALLPALSQATEQADAPRALMEQTSQKMFDVLAQEKAAIHKHPQRLFEVVDEVLSPHVDYTLLSRWVLGRYWRTADAAQRERFIKEFHTLLVRFYSKALLDDPSQIDQLLAKRDSLITFLPTRPGESPREASVRAQVNLAGTKPVPVSFSMYKEGDTWKVYDVNVDNISLAATYRSTYASEIQRAGMNGLLDKMAEQNQNLLAKTTKAGAK